MNAIVDTRPAVQPAATPTAATGFAAAGSDFANKFVTALNPSGWETTNMGMRNFFGDANSAARYLISNRQPAQVLDAMAAADPQLKELTDAIKADPQLATAFHAALHKDETVIPGLQRMMADRGAEGMSIQDLATQLRDTGPVGQVARSQLTGALTLVANEPDVKFDHIEKLGRQAKRMNAMMDFDLLRRDPDSYSRNLINALDIQDPQMKQMMAGLAHHLAPLFAAVFHPQGFLLQDFTAFAQKYNLTNPDQLAAGIRETGQRVLNGGTAPAADTTQQTALPTAGTTTAQTTTTPEQTPVTPEQTATAPEQTPAETPADTSQIQLTQSYLPLVGSGMPFLVDRPIGLAGANGIGLHNSFGIMSSGQSLGIPGFHTPGADMIFNPLTPRYGGLGFGG